jgi:hypothetical protein
VTWAWAAIIIIEVAYAVVDRAMVASAQEAMWRERESNNFYQGVEAQATLDERGPRRVPPH